MSLAVIGLVGEVFKGVFGLGKELIVDKDKQIEFAYKAAELQNALSMQLLSQSTVPWVDATVKLLLVSKQFVRPIGSAFVTGFGLYAHYKGIAIDTGLHAMLDAAFPGWMTSRHFDKNKNQ